MKYRAEIDGLRAVAVIPVILFHAGVSSFGGGFVGVDVFFVISGYLITTIILSEMEKGTFSLANFYERRARRILPAIFLIMLVSLPFSWFWLLPNDMRDFSKSLMAVSTFSSNILFWREAGYWIPINGLKPLLHTWSLAVEEQYYVLFPLFLLFMWRFRKRWILGSLMLLALASLTTAQWGAYHKPEAAFFLLPTRGWEIAIGAGISFHFLFGKQTLSFSNFQTHVGDLLGALGLLMIGYSVFFFDKNTPFPSLYTLIPTIGTGLIILFASSESLIGRLLSAKPLVAIGLISYSAYLWHQPLLAFAKHGNIQGISPVTIALLSFPLAFLSWRFVEKPFRKKGVLTQRTVFMSSALASLAFIGIGLTGYLTTGFSQRFNSEILELTFPISGKVYRCLDVERRTKGHSCIIGSKLSPALALIGDSHSAILTKSLDEILKNNNKSMVVYSQSWCAPLLDFGTDAPNKNPLCRNFIRESFKSINSDGNIKTVILVAEWANYTKGIRGADKNISYYADSLSKEKSLSENHAAFTRGLVRTADFLSRKNVILITSVPEYLTHIPKTLVKRRLSGIWDLPAEHQITLTKYQERNREVDSSLKKAKVKDWAIIIDSYSAFCRAGTCKYKIGNKPLYVDGNHLSYEGSQFITKLLKKYISPSLPTPAP